MIPATCPDVTASLMLSLKVVASFFLNQQYLQIEAASGQSKSCETWNSETSHTKYNRV